MLDSKFWKKYFEVYDVLHLNLIRFLGLLKYLKWKGRKNNRN
jgi:hypothetical protein